MSNKGIYQLSKNIEASAGRQLNDSQISQLQKTESYLEKHKIHEICNVYE